jgi:hypothetical protein
MYKVRSTVKAVILSGVIATMVSGCGNDSVEDSTTSTAKDDSAASIASKCDYTLYKAITKQTSMSEDDLAGMDKIINSALNVAKTIGWEDSNSNAKTCSYGFDVVNKYPFVTIETTEGNILKSFITKPFQISWTKDIYGTDAKCFDISAQKITSHSGRDAEWCGRN